MGHGVSGVRLVSKWLVSLGYFGGYNTSYYPGIANPMAHLSREWMEMGEWDDY
jgi:hypothetical protein